MTQTESTGKHYRVPFYVIHRNTGRVMLAEQVTEDHYRCRLPNQAVSPGCWASYNARMFAMYFKAHQLP